MGRPPWESRKEKNAENNRKTSSSTLRTALLCVYSFAMFCSSTATNKASIWFTHKRRHTHNRYNRQLLLLCVQSSFYYFSFCSKEAVPPIRFILNLIDAEIGRCVNQFLPCVLFTESGKWKIHKVPYGWSSFSCCNSAGRRKIFIPPKQIRKQQNLFSQFCDSCPKEKKKPTNIIYKRRQKEENKYKYTSQCYSLYYGGV